MIVKCVNKECLNCVYFDFVFDFLGKGEYMKVFIVFNEILLEFVF